MERREFLKLTLGFTAAAGSIAAMAATAQAAPMVGAMSGDMPPAGTEASKADTTRMQAEAASTAHNDLSAAEDTDMSSQRRRRRFWRRRIWRPRILRRRRRVFY